MSQTVWFLSAHWLGATIPKHSPGLIMLTSHLLFRLAAIFIVFGACRSEALVRLKSPKFIRGIDLFCSQSLIQRERVDCFGFNGGSHLLRFLE
ncbi:hypothetical protein RRG08_060611 [Elysia crispata]|uniref:Uncharacterized protein n=1 Tax=Elysia crispata TaxID=231223 RepID=A0AAE0Z4U9_9GAST|nr:hypothetical protein RRG08_060611 [Elysia crispata]